MVLTPCRHSRNLHRPKDSSFDSSIGPIVFQKAIKSDLRASDDYPKCTAISLSGGLLAALFNYKYHHRGLPSTPLCVEQFLLCYKAVVVCRCSAVSSVVYAT